MGFGSWRPDLGVSCAGWCSPGNPASTFSEVNSRPQWQQVGGISGPKQIFTRLLTAFSAKFVSDLLTIRHDYETEILECTLKWRIPATEIWSKEGCATLRNVRKITRFSQIFYHTKSLLRRASLLRKERLHNPAKGSFCLVQARIEGLVFPSISNHWWPSISSESKIAKARGIAILSSSERSETQELGSSSQKRKFQQTAHVLFPLASITFLWRESCSNSRFWNLSCCGLSNKWVRASCN